MFTQLALIARWCWIYQIGWCWTWYAIHQFTIISTFQMMRNSRNSKQVFWGGTSLVCTSRIQTQVVLAKRRNSLALAEIEEIEGNLIEHFKNAVEGFDLGFTRCEYTTHQRSSFLTKPLSRNELFDCWAKRSRCRYYMWEYGQARTSITYLGICSTYFWWEEMSILYARRIFMVWYSVQISITLGKIISQQWNCVNMV